MNVFKTEKGRDLVYEAYDKVLKHWDVEFTELDIETSYGKTHVIIAGKKENPPLLLFHGVGDNSAGMWKHNIKGLSEKFYCIAVDTIGGSGKSVPDNRYGKGFKLTQWYCDILDEFKIKKTYVSGVSYGCDHSVRFAIMCPDRVLKIVGIAGCPTVEGYKLNNIGKVILLAIPVMIFPTNNNFIKFFKKFLGKDIDITTIDKELINGFILCGKKYNPMSQRFHDRHPFSVDQVKMIKDKSLFLLGDSDRVAFYPEVLRVLNDLGLNYRIFKGAGHTLNMEQADEVNKAIIQFLL